MKLTLHALAWACILGACLDKASVDNDGANTAPAGAIVGASDTSRAGAPASAATPVSPTRAAGRGGEGAPGGSSAPAPSSAGGAASGTAGAVAAGSGGASAPSAPGASALAGSATRASCTSYQTPEDGMCGGYYCGVDEATLGAALSPTAKCAASAAFVCGGLVVRTVGDCARQVKAANFGASNAELRPAARACAFENAEIKQNVDEACLDCFLDAADCAGDHCLLECLAGNSPDCDRCSREHDCQAPVFACGGLPSPL